MLTIVAKPSKATAEMAKVKDFYDLLGVPLGEFEINGCTVGYPLKNLPRVQGQDVDEVMSWLD